MAPGPQSHVGSGGATGIHDSREISPTGDKENASDVRQLGSDRFARPAPVKRPRVASTNEYDPDLADGYLLSQMDDADRAGVTWKSVSPPRHRAHIATRATAGGTGPAGGAVMNQLLFMGRGNAAAKEQAAMRNKLTRQLDAFGAGDAVAGVESTLESPRTLDSSGAALLADVRAMEGCAPTPRAHRAHGSVGPTIGTARTPGSASSLGRQSVPTPGSGVRLGDVKGNGDILELLGNIEEHIPHSETVAGVSIRGDDVDRPTVTVQAQPGERPREDVKPAPEVAENKGPSEFQCDDDFDDFDLEAYAETEQLAIANKRKETAATAAVAPTATAAVAPTTSHEATAIDADKEHEVESERLARIEAEGCALDAWMVESVAWGPDHSLEVVARVCKAEEGDSNVRTLRLHDMWAESKIRPGDLIRLVAPHARSGPPINLGVPGNGFDISAPIDVTQHSGQLLVIHPSHLVNSTSVGGSMECLRRTVLQAVVPDVGGAEHAQAAMLGTLSHELSEASLFAAAFNTGPGAKGFFKHSAELVEGSSDRLFSSGTTEKEALDRLRYVGPGVHRWTRRLVKHPAQPGMANLGGAPGAAAGPGVECRVLASGAHRSDGMVAVTKMVEAEETVWAPTLGLRGVIDAVAVGKLDEIGKDGKKVVSSGMVPVELKTGYWRNPTEHGAQLTLYTLMLGERYGTRVPWGLLHYTRHPGGSDKDKKDDETVAIRPGPVDLAFLMHRRNMIATTLRPRDAKQIEEGEIMFAGGALPPIDTCSSVCKKCFVKEKCYAVNAALEGGSTKLQDSSLTELSQELVGHITDVHAAELARWLRLIDIEAASMSARRATPWIPVEEVRKRGGFAMDGFALRHVPRDDDTERSQGRQYLYALETGFADNSDSSVDSDVSFAAQHWDGADDSLAAALRPGDRLVLSRQQGAVVVARVILANVKERKLGVHLEVEMERPVRTTGPGAASPKELWRIDRDDGGATMAGRLRAAVLGVFQSRDPRAEALRARIFDLNPPRFDRAEAAAAMRSLSPAASTVVAALNEEQRGAVEHILGARDYALVVGLPGAGKSATLAATIKALVDMGKSVLVTSHTHNAVDNILARLPDVGIDDFLRVGGDDGKCAPKIAAYLPGGERHRAKTTAELADLANRARVVGATCYAAANNPMITRRESKGKGSGADGYFDVVLVDEAGQMTTPASLAPLLLGGVFVLVGDPHQLPPLVQSKEAERLGLGVSLLQRLTEAHGDISVAELRTQYRMADELAKFSNVISYSGKLRAGTAEVANRTLVAPIPAPADFPDWLRVATDPMRRVVMLDTSEVGAAAMEREGAKPDNEYERTVVARVLRGLLARGAAPTDIAVLSPYNAQVDAMARDLASSDDLKEVEALTIDRAQGRDVECVVISLVRANQRRETGGLLSNRRRLNVALTRARSKLVIVGNAETLQGSYEMQQVMGICSANAWITRLPGM